MFRKRPLDDPALGIGVPRHGGYAAALTASMGCLTAPALLLAGLVCRQQRA
ncbi:MAG TPA: hypothetical protein VND19_15825 [Acetobacteraceae bacterium]|nr:hypothetical protein [Acetobacteraceae bacterium]